MDRLMYSVTGDDFKFFPEESREHQKSSDIGMQFWYTKYLASTLTQLHAYRMGHACALGPIHTVIDMFAGVGASAKTLRELHPEIVRYIAFDHDVNSVEAFKVNNPGVEIYCEDSYVEGVRTLEKVKADYVILDFNATSFARMITDAREKRMYDATFGANRPTYVLLTDSALGKLHLHHKTYTERLARPVEDPVSYVQAVNLYAQEHDGYGITMACRDAYVGIYLFQKDYEGPVTFVTDLRSRVDASAARIEKEV